MIAPPDDRAQLEFLQYIQRVFDEGEFVATYKFALLVALAELSIERGDDTGASLVLDLRSIAEKFIEQYWQHAVPYRSVRPGAEPMVLVQNNGRQAAIVTLVAEAQVKFATLTSARASKEWARFVSKVAQIVEKMPLWKLQTLRRQSVPFLYDKGGDPGSIALLPGVAFCLRRFGALIQLLARNSWVHHIRSNPRNASSIGEASDLEVFLFGAARASLATAKNVLVEVQNNRCFYCESPMTVDPHVDHFIPWSRYRRDLAHNFVLAHQACNVDKGDMLAGPGHLARWMKRNEEVGGALASRLSPAGFIDDLPAAVQVARWAYHQAEATSAQLWVGLKYTINSDRTCLSILGA